MRMEESRAMTRNVTYFQHHASAWTTPKNALIYFKMLVLPRRNILKVRWWCAVLYPTVIVKINVSSLIIRVICDKSSIFFNDLQTLHAKCKFLTIDPLSQVSITMEKQHRRHGSLTIPESFFKERWLREMSAKNVSYKLQLALRTAQEPFR